MRLNKPERAAKAILNDGDLIVADVGAAFGLPWHLRVLERIATVLYFEPDHDAAEDIRRIAREQGIEEGYRTVLNVGPGAGQSVFHLHVHLIGGRPLRWPPG